jgi:hypothetical protein
VAGLAAGLHLLAQGGDALLGLGEPPRHLVRRQQFEIFLRKVESRFELGKQVEQPLAQGRQGPGQTAGQLPQGGVELLLAASFDHAQHGLGLRQVDPSGD